MTDALDRLMTALADRYSIEREIGAGGMATVYLAEDLKHHRKVAIKVLRPELAAALGAERFHQEIEIAARLNHPNILPLLDSGSVEEQPSASTPVRPSAFLYYVMPYIGGESLRDRLANEGELPIAEAVRILRDVVDALTHAHKHNVVHRDIKPDNVMLSDRHALVTDFGVAKAVSEATGRQQLTTEGVALGTPSYMAPEQAAADPHIDHRADIYAVGAVAYELLTARPPFLGTTPQMILSAHMTDSPEPVAKYRELVPPALEHLVMRCLEKKPADRWQTAEELLQQLEALATPSAGVTPAGTMSLHRVPKRRWMMLGGAAGVAAVIAVIIAIAAFPRVSSVVLDPNHVVVAVFRNETGDPSLDQLGSRIGHWITQGLQQAAIPVTPWDMALQSSSYIQGEAEAGRIRNPVKAFAEQTGAGTVISGAVYLEGDSIEIQVDVTDATRGRLLGTPAPVTGGRDAQRELISDVQQQVMVFLSVYFDETVTDNTPSFFSEAPSFEAYQAFLRGRELQSAMDFEGAVPHYRRASELDSAWAHPVARLRQMLAVTGRVAESESVLVVLEGMWDRLSQYERAEVESFRAESDGDREAVVRALRRAVALAPNSGSLSNLGMHLWRLNRPREAADLFLNVDPTRGWWREWLGYWHMLAISFNMLGEYEQALDVALRCRQQHPENSVCLEHQSDALAALGRINKLNSVLDELEVIPNVPPYTLVDIIEFLRYHGHADAAKEVAGRAIRWFEGRPPNEATSLDNRHEYGRALFFAGRSDEAQRIFDAIVDDYPEDAANRMFRAFIAASRGDTAQALSDARSLEAQAELLGGFQKDEARWWCRGVIYAALGDLELAWELFRQFEPRWEHSAWDHVRVVYEPLRDHAEFQEFMRPKG